MLSIVICGILLTDTRESTIIQHFNMKRIFKFPADIKNFKQIVFHWKGYVMVMQTKLPMGIENALQHYWTGGAAVFLSFRE